MITRPNFLVGLICSMLLCAAIRCERLPAQDDAEKQPTYTHPFLIRVEGEIGPWLEAYVNRKIDLALAQDCDLLIFEIESPGGRLFETERLCDRILALKNVHTVAFVPKEAISGAAILSLACDEIIVAEHGLIGDCGPIFLAEDFLFRHAPEKIRSDLAARVRTYAERNGHDPALAEAMVDHELKVHRVRMKHEESERLLTHRELEAAGEEVTDLGPLPESGEGRFLELNGRRALELGLSSAALETRDEVAKRFNLSSPPRVLVPNAVDQAVYTLNRPLVTALLFIIGLVAIAYEFASPGVIIGGLFGGLCFAIFFWSRFLGGTADWLEVVLFLSGVAFLGVELFVLPGFGIAGVTGVVLMGAGMMLALHDFTLPDTNERLGEFLRSFFLVSAAGVVALIVTGLLIRNLRSLPVLNRLLLAPPEQITQDVPPPSSPVHSDAPPLKTEVMVGDWGWAITPLRPSGKGRFEELIIDVVSQDAFIEPGTQIHVIGKQGTRILVENAERLL